MWTRWRGFGSRWAWLVCVGLIGVMPVEASTCAGSNTIFFTNITHTSPTPGLCLGAFYCDKPLVQAEPFYRLANPSCDPATTACGVQAVVEYEIPGNKKNSFPTLANIHWFNSSPAPWCDPRSLPTGCSPAPIANCGVLGGPAITQDRVETYVTISNVTCSNAATTTATYSTRAWACAGSSSCQSFESIDGIKLGGPEMAAAIGCPVPPQDECDDCKACPAAGAGANAGGGGSTVSPAGSGPGARLRYRSGGAGGSGLPGSADWTPTLGLFWSHDYAGRIVMDPDETHVWLITEYGSFREFTDLVTGTYTTNRPSDEYRTLTRTATGWELTGLDGTVDEFEEVSGAGYGRWISTTDRNGNAKSGTYDLISGDLTTVTFPDGRSETFTYAAAGGKLASITEVGTDGTTTRAWTYTWTSDELTRIDRPDGTAWEFIYDPARPGYLIRQELEGTDSTSQRVERAWDYDAQGNVTATWQGDAGSAGPNAVNLWSFAYTNPALPTSTDVTDPLGQVATYTIGRDPNSPKARVTQIQGSCPTCGLGPNSAFEYSDSVNPMLPTAIVDGKGHRTEMTYDGNGRVLTRTEAVLEPEERTTTFTYDVNFPAFVASTEVPSTSGGMSVRKESMIFDASGDATLRRIEGVESGSAFTYDTVMTYNAAGRTWTIDPPGYGTTDLTTFTYDAARGDLVPLTRVDSLIGTTTFGHDPFNRRMSVTDPNGVVAETEYDALDRVTKVIQRGATAPDDLVTENVYSIFGDLEKTTLPEGNVLFYEYDTAGRLESVSRGPLVTDLRERTFYTTDVAGNRIKEELQRWDAGTTAWVTESETDFVYATRCYLDKIVRVPGTPDEATTEYRYDCNGNLEKVWDANHDSAVDPESQLYAYDSLDRLATVTQPWPGGGTAVTTYAYDIQDHLTSVTDAEANVTTYTYSDRDLLTRQVSPASGQTDYTYNDHGELTVETDARGITVNRTVDEFDRVTFVDYPDATLDTTYVYDDPLVPFSLGRLTSIQRNGGSVDYLYDRVGRPTQDGGLTYAYNKNGNKTTIGYPGGATATYTYDFADRHETLSVDDGVNPVQNVVTASTYLPSGPLTSLTLGNGLTETRGFDGRYFPASIDISGGLGRTWTYTTDNVGNVTQIVETVGCTPTVTVNNQTLSTPLLFQACQEVSSENTTIQAPGGVVYQAGDQVVLGEDFTVETGAEFAAIVDNRLLGTTFSYTYQDHQYFLTQGVGHWGTLDYTYDKIGNRLTEARTVLVEGSPVTTTDVSAYTSNGVGNTPILASIALGVGGTKTYSYGAAGHLDEVSTGGNLIDFTSNDAGRLSGLDRLGSTTSMDYDGRSFLQKVEKPLGGGDFQTTEPRYSSVGFLQALSRKASAAAPVEETSYVYFAGRPVAQLKQEASASTWTLFAADHLGTPFLATDSSGVETWLGPFEPFGRDTLAGTSFGAESNEVYLRLPGQWAESAWSESSSGADMYYNLHRWYEDGTGRYARVDPLGLRGSSTPMIYGYAESNPLVISDPFGLCTCEDDCSGGEWTYIGASTGFAFGGGMSHARGFYQCDSDPSVTLKVKATCGVIGYALWFGGDFTTGGIPGACGCNKEDLTGRKWSFFFGASVLSKSFSGCDVGRRAGGLGISAGVPLSAAFLVCDFARK